MAVTARALLLRLGMGEFNATQVIPFLFMAPTATDADSPSIILLVQHLQRELAAMGASVRVDGRLSANTASALRALCGDRWVRWPWFDIVNRVLEARAANTSLSTGGPSDLSGCGCGSCAACGGGLSGLLPDLPDIPGGAVTVGLAAFAGWALYKNLKKRKGR